MLGSVCYGERVVCCLIFVSNGSRETCKVRFIPLVMVVFAYTWSGMLEGDGRDCVILVPWEDIGGEKFRRAPNKDIIVDEGVVSMLQGFS